MRCFFGTESTQHHGSSALKTSSIRAHPLSAGLIGPIAVNVLASIYQNMDPLIKI